jgi:hypothetical protein
LEDAETKTDEIMHIFAAPDAYIQILPWPPPFTMMERQGCGAALKATLSQGQLKYKKVRMMTSLAWIQLHPCGAILKHILNTVNSFLYSSVNYLENRLLPNDSIIVRNHGDNEEDIRDTKDVLESPRDVHNKVEIQTNSEFQSLTSSPTRSPRPPCIQIDAQDSYDL